MMEKWAVIQARPAYEVSTRGRVRRSDNGRILEGSVRPDGYRQVGLGRGYYKLVHALVLEVFVGPRPDGMLGLHRNDVKSDNSLENLYWGTHQQNSHDRVSNRRSRGFDAAAAKLTREQVLEICRLLDDGEKMDAIAERFDVSRMLITHINTGHAWQWLTKRSAKNARMGAHMNSARKLDATKAREIVRMRSNGTSRRELADLFSVRVQTVDQVLNGTIWSHATGVR